MLKIDVKSIRDHSEELRNLVSEYETTSMSLVQEVINQDTNWFDDNSGFFFEDVKQQKQEIAKLVTSLEDVCNRYDDIADSINAIESSINKVFCDQTYKGRIKNKYDVAITKINNLLSSLNGASTYFCNYSERSAINSAKNSLSKAVKRLEDSSNEVERLITELSRLESTIISTISGISIESIRELDLSKYLSL
jgi:chromosome segregation ATPase